MISIIKSWNVKFMMFSFIHYGGKYYGSICSKFVWKCSKNFFLDEVLQLKKLKNIGYQFLILKIYVIKFILV
jgi:hypothetical protein